MVWGRPVADAVHRTLTDGPADAMGPDVPGLVWGCLLWDDPEAPLLDDALEHWHPVHWPLGQMLPS